MGIFLHKEINFSIKKWEFTRTVYILNKKLLNFNVFK